MNDPAFLAAEAAVLAQMRVERGRRAAGRIAGATALVLAAGLMLGFARSPLGDIRGTLIIIVLCAAALFVQKPLALLGAFAIGSAGLTALGAHAAFQGPSRGGGVHCATLELIAACVPFFCVLAMMAWNRDPIRPMALAATAGAGALAGQATLYEICNAAGDTEHLLLFHSGGVVISSASLALLAVAASAFFRQRALRTR